MRHEANLMAALENMSRAAFRIAEELSQNSRSGLTVRFLAKKLDLPEEEIEYLVDLNHRLFFTDLTKVKLVPAGLSAVKRITDGLENHGDVESLFRHVRQLDSHDFQHLEEHLGFKEPIGKKQAAEHLLEHHYAQPEALIEYVATRGFSPEAKELFDAVWQMEGGITPVHALRATQSMPEHELERALWELCRGFALIEMFRFDSEERLVRFAGLLKELRQWREADASRRSRQPSLKPHRNGSATSVSEGVQLSDRISQLVAAVAAKPVRLRSDGELFREDRRRLGEICPEEGDPSLSTCLWVAEAVGWLVRAEEELRAGDLDALIRMDRVGRHRVVFEWLTAGGNEADSRRTLATLAEDMKPGAWYSTNEFIAYALRMRLDNEQPLLKCTNGQWRYVSPSAAPNADRNLARSIEETFRWLGLVEQAGNDGELLFRSTDLGRCLLRGTTCDSLEDLFARRDAEFVVQPNFDIVVPTQDGDPLLTVPLDQFAERVSSGNATVYNLTKDSFTRGIQSGLDGDAFISFLLAHNRGGTLPRNVMTTLEDWRGGVKRVRLRTLHVLESDDPLVIADLQHRRRLGKFVQPIDPRRVVSFSKINKADLEKELEKEGFVVG
ncbi:MAG: helicase-associated domain-containing protein [FCB group bacterium]|jgi:hypothetical protein|nr:helicase-associated domain-containing protein [FCB group bacterium]